MQCFYALEQNKESLFNISLNKIADSFAENINLENQDKRLLSKRKMEASELFKKSFKINEIKAQGEDQISVNEAIAVKNWYNAQLNRYVGNHKRRMIQDTTQLYDRYLSLLALIIGISDFAIEQKDKIEEKDKKESVTSATAPKDENLMNNIFIRKLLDWDELKAEWNRKDPSWYSKKDLISKLYKAIHADEEYQSYRAIQSPTATEDKELILHLIKNIFFKNESLNSFLEEEDLWWEENKFVIKNMLIKTIKFLENDQRELLELSYNWKQDLPFFEFLFQETAKNNDWLEQKITAKAKNWSGNRIAIIDKILLKLALTEMISFPTIPVKVTINEYIEISKKYSTPKSNKFVNGLLDSLREELIEEGKVRKSGRGLIDN